MNSVVKISFLSVVLLLGASLAGAQTPTPRTVAGSSTDIPNPKIAIINPNAFAESIGELKGHYEKLAAEFTPRKSEIETLRSTMDAKQKQLEDNGAKMTPQQVRKLQDDIEQLKKEGTRKMEDYQNDLTKREEALTGATYNKITEFMAKYSTEKNITVVWNYNKIVELGVILYVDPKSDITQDFITAYNKANPAATAQNGAAAPKKP